MYITNNRSKRNKYSKYNISDFPANYSGQYTEDSIRHKIYDADDVIEIDLDSDKFDGGTNDEKGRNDKKNGQSHDDRDNKNNKDDRTKAVQTHAETKPDQHEKPKEKKDHSHSLIGNLLHGKDKDNGGDGLLSSLMGKKNENGGLLSSIEVEDLILLAVIFFLLKDGVEDDLLIILALILFA